MHCPFQCKVLGKKKALEKEIEIRRQTGREKEGGRDRRGEKEGERDREITDLVESGLFFRSITGIIN